MERRVHLVRNPLGDATNSSAATSEDRLEAAALAGVCAVMRQMAALTSHACGIFDELQAEVDTVASRSSAISARLDALQLRFSEDSDGLLPPPRNKHYARTDERQPPPAPAGTIESLLGSASEPAAVTAALERCRPPPNLNSLEEFLEPEEPPCQLRYSQTSLGDLWQRRATPRAGTRRYGAAAASISEERSLAPGGAETPGPSPGGGSSSRGSRDIIPAAQPGGDSPTIGRRGAPKQPPPLPVLVAPGPGSSSSSDLQEYGRTLAEAAVREEGEGEERHSEECGFFTPLAADQEAPGSSAWAASPRVGAAPPEADTAGSSPDSAFKPFPSLPSPSPLGGPTVCTSPAVKGRNRGVPAGVELDPSNPFITPQMEAPARPTELQQPSWEDGIGSPDRYSEAATEVTLSNYCAGDVPPPITCASPAKGAGRSGGSSSPPMGSASLSPTRPRDPPPARRSPRFNAVEAEATAAAAPSSSPSSSPSRKGAPPPPPPPLAPKPKAGPPPPPPPPPPQLASKPRARGPPPPPPPPPPPSLAPATHAPSGTSAAAPSGGRPFSASDLLASRSKLKSAAPPEAPKAEREAGGETQSCGGTSASPRPNPPAGGGMIGFSAADLLASKSKLKRPQPKEAANKPKPQESTDPRSQMLEMIKSGSVQLRKTPTSTPPGGHTPTGARSPRGQGPGGAPPGGTHMAALLQKVNAIRQSTQDDSDDSWDD